MNRPITVRVYARSGEENQSKAYVQAALLRKYFIPVGNQVLFSVYIESCTDAVTQPQERPVFRKLLSELEPGDIIAVTDYEIIGTKEQRADIFKFTTSKGITFALPTYVRNGIVMKYALLDLVQPGTGDTPSLGHVNTSDVVVIDDVSIESSSKPFGHVSGNTTVTVTTTTSIGNNEPRPQVAQVSIEPSRPVARSQDLEIVDTIRKLRREYPDLSADKFIELLKDRGIKCNGKDFTMYTFKNLCVLGKIPFLGLPRAVIGSKPV